MWWGLGLAHKADRQADYSFCHVVTARTALTTPLTAVVSLKLEFLKKLVLEASSLLSIDKET
jgi:hypothetical protein